MSYQCPRPCENKTEYGYCKTTNCINPQFSNLGTWQQTILQHGTLKLKPQTNADRIRGMSDEELAEFLCKTVSPSGTVNCGACRAQEFCKMGRNGFRDWLAQPAK